MDDPAFTNLVVTYNGAAEVSGLLADLRLHAPGSRTIVIDNASPDATADVVNARFPEVQLIRNSANVGYARAVNQGFRLTATKYVFLLNPDIRIASADVFRDLRNCLESEPRVAVAGPLQFKGNGGNRRLNFTWSYWTPAAFRVYLSHRLGRGDASPTPIRVAFLNAGCLFIRRAAFEAVGRLNEKYFLYGEEPDLFLKLKRYGHECRLLPGISVIHNREQSLKTVPPLRRLLFKLQGIRNIGDAVVTGSVQLLLDKLMGRKPA